MWELSDFLLLHGMSIRFAPFIFVVLRKLCMLQFVYLFIAMSLLNISNCSPTSWDSNPEDPIGMFSCTRSPLVRLNENFVIFFGVLDLHFYSYPYSISTSVVGHVCNHSPEHVQCARTSLRHLCTLIFEPIAVRKSLKISTTEALSQAQER